MTNDLAAAIDALDGSTREFLSTLEGLTDAEWQWRPEAGKWSIGEVAEHTATVLRGIERLCRTRLAEMPIGEGNQPRVGDLDVVGALDLDSRRLPAPEMVKPKGRWSNPAELGEAMQASSDLLVAWARETPLDLRRIAAPHPLFGPLDGLQWLLMVGAHSRRHGRQVAELRKRWANGE